MASPEPGTPDRGEPDRGVVDALWLKPAHRLPMRIVDALTLSEGHGIEGNADVGRRQVAIISSERWQQACAVLDAQLDPVLRRANDPEEMCRIVVSAFQQQAASATAS